MVFPCLPAQRGVLRLRARRCHRFAFQAKRRCVTWLCFAISLRTARSWTRAIACPRRRSTVRSPTWSTRTWPREKGSCISHDCLAAVDFGSIYEWYSVIRICHNLRMQRQGTRKLLLCIVFRVRGLEFMLRWHEPWIRGYRRNADCIRIWEKTSTIENHVCV